MHVELGHEPEQQLFLDRQVVLGMVMQDFETLQYLWMIVNFIKNGMLYLMVLYHAKNRNFPSKKKE